MSSKSSIGIKILAGLQLFIGLCCFCFSSYHITKYILLNPPYRLEKFLYYVFSGGACFIVLGTGLLRLKELARVMNNVLITIYLLYNGFWIYRGFFGDTAAAAFVWLFLLLQSPIILYSLLALFFFTRPKVAAQFQLPGLEMGERFSEPHT